MRASIPFLVASAITASALVIPHDRGEWPGDWPKELEPLRVRSRTTEWATGNRENWHQIPFETRREFRKFWPVFCKMLQPGAKLILLSPAAEKTPLVDLTKAMVVIRVSAASFESDETKTPQSGLEWPRNACQPDGRLPEYVLDEGGEAERKWVLIEDLDPAEFSGFRFRARIDIMLICDGKVIDLNRIKFPEGVRVIDERKLAKE